MTDNDIIATRLPEFVGCLEYVEDFNRAMRDTLRDPAGRAALTTAYQQAQADGRDRGGRQCCGSTTEWHRPWCEEEPRHHRAPEPVAMYEVPGHVLTTMRDDIARLSAAIADRDAEIARLKAELAETGRGTVR
jgi:hypothetical protein